VRRQTNPSPRFQSPCGVLGVCRLSKQRVVESYTIPHVSVPLRGFRGLQVPHLEGQSRCQVPFQSPCGVLGVCRFDPLCFIARSVHVSVPLRGFRGLQAFLSDVMDNKSRQVSVPLRGFRGLQEVLGSSFLTTVC